MGAKHTPSCTFGKWSVSVTTGTGIQGAIVSVKRHYEPSRDGTSRYIMAGGELDGATFPSDVEAWEAIRAKGYSVPFYRMRNPRTVAERADYHAKVQTRNGLPTREYPRC